MVSFSFVGIVFYDHFFVIYKTVKSLTGSLLMFTITVWLDCKQISKNTAFTPLLNKLCSVDAVAESYTNPVWTYNLFLSYSSHRYYCDTERGAPGLQGHQVVYPSDPRADRRSSESGGGQQAHQLSGLPEGELCGHPGALPQQPGEVSQRLLCAHHLKPPETGTHKHTHTKKQPPP